MILAVPILAALVVSEPSSVEKAEAAWAKGDYETAAAQWALAYEETGDIRHVFARGQALANLDRCEEAIEVLEAFIATEPKEVAAKAARETIDVCRESLPEPEPEPEAPEQPPPPVLDEDPRPPTPPPPKRWIEDPLGGVLMASGGVTLAAGAVLAGVARTQRAAAEASNDLPTFARHDDRAVQLSRISVPVLSVGAALVVGSIVRYVVVARRNRRETAWYGGQRGL